jgi:hypothetical protein
LALKSIASVHVAVVFRKMTLEVAAIVKDASDVDYIPIVAAPVKDEMARIVYDAEGSLSAVAAETDMVRPSPFYHDLGPIDGTVTVGLALDVAERLHDQRFVTRSGVMAELRFAPSQGVAKIAASFAREDDLQMAALCQPRFRAPATSAETSCPI